MAPHSLLHRAAPSVALVPTSNSRIRRIFNNDQIIEKFDNWLLICGKSKNARDSYRLAAKRLAKFIINKPLIDIIRSFWLIKTESFTTTPFDIIVTDMRMPGVDGATLLEIVREKDPSVLRIILSGYTEMQASLRAVPVAHQFLLKPCDPDMLRAGISRATSLGKVLDRRMLTSLVGALREIFFADKNEDCCESQDEW